MRLKYAQQVAAVPMCPPKDSKPCEGRFARLLFEDPNHRSNFSPPAALDPKRRFKDDLARCDAWGLSMFTSVARLKAHVVRIDQKYKRLRVQQIGTHIAEVDVRKEDGVATPVNRSGHFSLHEANEVVWKDRYSLVSEAA